MLPDIDYTKLTKENFIIGGIGSDNVESSWVRESRFHQSLTYEYNIDKSYDSSTGILTVGGNTQTVQLRYILNSEYYNSTRYYVKYKTHVYLVIGNIINV